jgi:hypothetical protein
MRCVHITQEQVDKLSHYYCATCKRRRNAQKEEKNVPANTNTTPNINTNNIYSTPTNINNTTNINSNVNTTTTATNISQPFSPVNTTNNSQPLPPLPQSAGPPVATASSGMLTPYTYSPPPFMLPPLYPPFFSSALYHNRKSFFLTLPSRYRHAKR